jgi:hypothetical protein
MCGSLDTSEKIEPQHSNMTHFIVGQATARKFVQVILYIKKTDHQHFMKMHFEFILVDQF